MRLSDRQFLLVTATALLAVATHFGQLPAWLAMCVPTLILLRVAHRRRTQRKVALWLRVPLLFTLLAAIVMQFGNVFGREPGSALACAMLAMKLLETESVRDARAALGFSAFVLMSALLNSQGLGITFAVCASLVPLLAALVALQPAATPTPHVWRSELKTAGALFGLGLPLALAAFLFVPRLGAPLWGSPGGFQDARTGLSDQMSPGSMTDLLIDDSPALRVTFAGAVPTPDTRYFRTLVMWDFDGASWLSSGWRRPGSAETLRTLAEPIDYEITLEPSMRPWLPALDVPLDVPLDAPADARMDSTHTLAARKQMGELRQYRLQSATSYRLGETLDERDRARALRLPAEFNPQTLALAEKWREESDSDLAISRKALELFNASFHYTLAAPLLGRHSVDEFLFDTRAGFCEHFSSAYVVLMRAAGIPARVVTGYQGGWWSTTGEYLLVRQSDAHAWAEIWLQDRGWVRVDPTSAVDPVRVEFNAASGGAGPDWMYGNWMRNLRNQLDLVNRMWTQMVVGFNAARQANLLQPLGISKATRSQLLLILSSGIALILLLATAWVLRGDKRRREDALDAAWRQLLVKLERSGLGLQPAEGPQTLLSRAKQHLRDHPVQPRLKLLVECYVRLRYATAEPAPQDIRAFANQVRALRLPGRGFGKR